MIWNWLGAIFHFRSPDNFDEVLKLAKHTLVQLLKKSWLSMLYAQSKKEWYLVVFSLQAEELT